jgi:hypothetical protein
MGEKCDPFGLPQSGYFLEVRPKNCSQHFLSKFESRYLTKLCEQVICLISDEDQAQLSWDPTDITGRFGEENPASKSSSKRAYRLQVQHINHEEESARAQDGFTVS